MNRTVTIPLSEYEYMKDEIKELNTYKNTKSYFIEEYYGSYSHKKMYAVNGDSLLEIFSRDYEKYKNEIKELNKEIAQLKKASDCRLCNLFKKRAEGNS